MADKKSTRGEDLISGLLVGKAIHREQNSDSLAEVGAGAKRNNHSWAIGVTPKQF